MLGNIGHAGGAAHQPAGLNQAQFQAIVSSVLQHVGGLQQQPGAFGAPQQPAAFGLQQPGGFGLPQQPGAFGAAPAGGLHPFNPLNNLRGRTNVFGGGLGATGGVNWANTWSNAANSIWPGSGGGSGGWGLSGWGFNTMAGPTAFWGSVNDDLNGGDLGGWSGRNGGGYGDGGGWGGRGDW